MTILRLLYARTGTPHCPQCDQLINPQTIDQIVDQVLSLPDGSKIQILAPVVAGRKGEYQSLFSELRKEGFARARVDGEILLLEDDIALDKNKKHDIALVIDRLVVRENIQSRLADSLQLALKWGKSVVLVDLIDQKKDLLFSEQFACASCNLSFAEILPRTFSFNSPHGACQACNGLGCTFEVDPDLVVPDANKSLAEGAIYPWSKTGNPYYQQILKSLSRHYKFSMDVPFKKLSAEHRKVILYGSGSEKVKLAHDSFDGSEFWEYRKTFEGIIGNLKRRYEESASDKVRQDVGNYMTQMQCPSCNGARLRPEALAVKVGNLSIAQLCALPVSDCVRFFADLPSAFSERQNTIAHQILIEINSRLRFLTDVGLEYLTLDRQAADTIRRRSPTHSPGHTNRLRFIRRPLCAR